LAGRVSPLRIDVACDGEHIVIYDSQKGFFIKIFDTEGNALLTIDKSPDVEPIPFTDADRAGYLESVRLNEDPRLFAQISKNARFKEHHPMINHVQLDDGKLFVTTNRTLGDKHEMLILDLDGRILETLFIPLSSHNPSRRILRFDPYVVSNGTLYEIVRNASSGIHELLATELTQ